VRGSINNINLLDDLGRVNHIFCDKTGTLTKNNLIFRSLAYDNQLFVKKGEDNFDLMR
jgi:P-type E1-E2 ATPase